MGLTYGPTSQRRARRLLSPLGDKRACAGRRRGRLTHALCLLAFVSVGCSTQRPVLYPDPYYRHVGKSKAEQDIDTCMDSARYAGLEESRAGRVAKESGTGAAVGGAAGGAYGLVRGDAGKSAAAGAAAGAATGAVRSGLRSGEPPPILRRYVERCLRDKGYDVIGWR